MAERIEKAVAILARGTVNETQAWNLWNLIASDDGDLRHAVEWAWKERDTHQAHRDWKNGVNAIATYTDSGIHRDPTLSGADGALRELVRLGWREPEQDRTDSGTDRG